MKLTPKHKTRLKRIILSLTILTLTYTSLYFWSIQHNITIDVAEKIAYGEALRYCIDNKLSEDCRGEMELVSKHKTFTMKYDAATMAYDDDVDVFSVGYIVDVNPDKREIIDVIMDLNGEGAHIDHKTIDYTKTRVSH